MGQLPSAVSDGVSGTRVQRLSPSLPSGAVRQPHSDPCWPRRERHARRSLSLSGRAELFLFSFLWGSPSSVALFIYFLAAGGFVPRPRIELRSSAVKAQVLTSGPVGNSPSLALEEVVPQPSLKPKEKNGHPMYTYENILPCFDPSVKKINYFLKDYTQSSTFPKRLGHLHQQINSPNW